MALSDLLLSGVKLVTLVFVVTSMLAMGMSLTIPQIVQPLKHGRLVAGSLLANFLFAPLFAYAITRVIPLERPLQTALIVVSTAAGAPFLPKLVQVARGNLAFGVGLMVLLTVITVGYMPLVVPLLLPGASANASDIASSLFTLMLLPLAAGLVIRWRLPLIAARWRGVMNTSSSVAVVALLVLNLVLNFSSLIRLVASGSILAILLFIAGCLATGYAVGGREPTIRSVTGLGAAQRNISASLVVTAQNFAGNDSFSLTMVIAFLLLVTLLPAGKWMSRRRPAEAVAEAVADAAPAAQVE
jgi:predicted Na+-dependent transporter